MDRSRLTVRVALALLVLALLPVGLVSWSATRSSEHAERGQLEAQAALSLQGAVSDLEQRLTGEELALQSFARSPALVAAVRSGNRNAIARLLEPGETVQLHGTTIGRKPAVALTRSLTVAVNSRPLAQVSRSLALTPALLAQIGRPLPLKGTTFAVANRAGRALVGAGRGQQLPSSGDVTVGGVRYRTFSAALGQAPYRLQALVPEQHLQQAISKERTKLVIIVGLTVFVALVLALLLGGSLLASLGDLFRKAAHADTDELTSLPNRRAFKEALAKEIHRSKRYGHPLSLALFDLDRFKQVNDRFGHLAGDRVLQATARAVERNLRDTDVFARVGGEEFALLLPDTDLDGAAELAERLRVALQAISPLSTDVDTQISASFGVVELDRTSDDDAGQALIAAADAALYNAKSLGRNQVHAEHLSQADHRSS